VPTRVAAAGRSPLRGFIDDMMTVRAQERELREAEPSSVASVGTAATAETRTRAKAVLAETAYTVVAGVKALKEGNTIGFLKA